MFNLFEIYRNHKRYLWIKQYGSYLLDDYDSRTKTRLSLIEKGDDIEYHKRAIFGYKCYSLQIKQLFDTDYKLHTFFGLKTFIRDFKLLDDFNKSANNRKYGSKKWFQR